MALITHDTAFDVMKTGGGGGGGHQGIQLGVAKCQFHVPTLKVSLMGGGGGGIRYFPPSSNMTNLWADK